jgi:hypothetical protein
MSSTLGRPRLDRIGLTGERRVDAAAMAPTVPIVPSVPMLDPIPEKKERRVGGGESLVAFTFGDLILIAIFVRSRGNFPFVMTNHARLFCRPSCQGKGEARLEAVASGLRAGACHAEVCVGQPCNRLASGLEGLGVLG